MSETLAERLRQITADDNDEVDVLFDAADEIERLRASEAKLREALERLIAACDRGRVVTKPGCGIGGMTLKENLRASNINGVSASAVEDARAALAEKEST